MTHKFHATSDFMHKSLIVFRSVKYLINYGIVQCFKLISVVAWLFVMFFYSLKYVPQN
ncbi:hypothetical protein HanRHA438_Chr06g0267221 [Helianthus annuus]|nr:hypothetical protein HanRHA438_Chr06g0267221 [Helianthus annuus]